MKIQKIQPIRQIQKARMSYDEWLKKYKGKTIKNVTLKEHELFHNQYKSWLVGNIWKV